MSDKVYDAFSAIAYIQNSVNPQYISPKYLESMDTIKNCIGEQRQEINSLKVYLTDRCRDVYKLSSRIAYLEEQLRWRPVSEKPIMNGKYEVKHMTIEGDKWVEIEFYPGNSWNSPIFDHVMWRPIPEASHERI